MEFLLIPCSRSLDSAKLLYKELGLRKGFYSGFRVIGCFQIVSFCAYFPIYELSLKIMTMKRDSITNQWRSNYIIGDVSKSNKKNVSSLQILFSGGISGIFSWIAGFPIDNIKVNFNQYGIIFNKLRISMISRDIPIFVRLCRRRSR